MRAAIAEARLLAAAAALCVCCGDVDAPRMGTAAPDAKPRNASSQARAVPLRLVIVGDLEGVVEPCGCGSRRAGGLDRLAAAVDRLRRGAARTIVLGAGNTLYGPVAGSALHRRQREWKAATVADVLRRAGVGTLAPGPQDLALGALQLGALGGAERGPRLVSAGLVQPQIESVAGAALLTEAGVAVGITAVIQTPSVALGAAVQGPTHPVAALSAQAESLRKQGAAIVIAAVHGDESTARRAAERIEGAIVVQTGAGAQAPGVTPSGARSLLARPGRYGEGLLRLDVWPAPGARGFRLLANASADDGQAHAAVAEYTALDDAAPRDPGVRAMLARLFARIHVEHAAAVSGQPESAVAGGYVGSETCAACHTAEYFWWKDTPHGRAFDTLVARGRELDLDCIGCHVTGFDERAELSGVAARKGVGCESCHGAGSAHADNPQPPHRDIRRDVPEAVCAACHDADHSPGFVYRERRVTLLAPGHGGGARR